MSGLPYPEQGQSSSSTSEPSAPSPGAAGSLCRTASQSSSSVGPSTASEPADAQPTGLEFVWPLYDGALSLDPVELLLVQRLTKVEPRKRQPKQRTHIRRLLFVPEPYGGWQQDATSPRTRKSEPHGRAAGEGARDREPDAADSDPTPAEAAAAARAGEDDDVWCIINDQQVFQHPVHGANLFTAPEVKQVAASPPCCPTLAWLRAVASFFLVLCWPFS